VGLQIVLRVLGWDLRWVASRLQRYLVGRLVRFQGLRVSVRWVGCGLRVPQVIQVFAFHFQLALYYGSITFQWVLQQQQIQ
jgi:hypothetical protein